MFPFVHIRNEIKDVDAFINDVEDKKINRYYFKKLKVNNS